MDVFAQLFWCRIRWRVHSPYTSSVFCPNKAAELLGATRFLIYGVIYYLSQLKPQKKRKKVNLNVVYVEYWTLAERLSAYIGPYHDVYNSYIVPIACKLSKKRVAPLLFTALSYAMCFSLVANERRHTVWGFPKKRKKKKQPNEHDRHTRSSLKRER